MPKMKSKGAVKKRFKLTASGKLKRHRCGHGHILTKKRPKRKRRLRQSTLVSTRDYRRIRTYLLV